MPERKGIILAGGSGTRLYPLSLGVSKQLMPVFDKPMVYYPLSTLMLAGIRQILVITRPEDVVLFRRVLGDGSQLGLEIQYAEQPRPEGLAQAFHIGADFLEDGPSALVLGDNVFFGHGLPELLGRAGERQSGASVFAYRVGNPQSYGVVAFDEEGIVSSLEEKPREPKSSFAVTGLYFYDETAVERALDLRPSPRGELEITDLNKSYLSDRKLYVEMMGRGYAWLDTGTHASLLDAANFVRIIEERQGMKVCCPEEIAWRKGFITDESFEELAQALRTSGYGEYLLQLMEQGKSE
jgi:glucose-1-phosphate thymidylyltransferase